MTSDTRPPYQMRAKTSRPVSSVPNQWSADGRCSGADSIRAGSWRLTRPMERDMAVISSRTASPAMALFWRRSTRSLRGSIVDPGVDERVEDVDGQIDGDEGGRDDER